ncbi:MAG TPA: kelch repeat-containing protein [Bacteroidia bacterium]|nr:kelch repeat-containing protein [Bacteroidia bacterium]
MKRLYTFLLSCITLSGLSQTWTWMKGNTVISQAGVYGTVGIASPGNNPGCRHGAATWVDNLGNLWLFGGEGYDNTTTLGWQNDLWKYSATTNQWTWMGGSNTSNQIGTYGSLGVPSPSNQPGAREFSIHWVDANGNFWLFGGDGFASTATFGRLGDLWKYNPTSNQWTWMHGFNTVVQNGVYGTLGVPSSSNMPGCRYAAATWTDASGKLWMFGGRGYPAAGFDGFLNDLWKYDPLTNQWTWVNGSNVTGQNSVHGTLNVAAPANMPGGLEFASYWTDANTLYLFGGRGLPAAGGASYLNALWKYNIGTNQWTWINGSTGALQLGQYGTQSVPSVTNVPGARMSAACWTDGSGNLWLYGGLGTATVAGVNDLNDVFCYNLSGNTWTWVKGANYTIPTASYGTQGIPSMTTTPGGRRYNTWWKRNNGEFWIFGGEGYAALSVFGNNDDLWKFTPSCNPETISAIPNTTLCSGGNLTLSCIPVTTASINWYNVSSGGTSLASGSVFVTPALTASGSNSVYIYYSESANCPGYPRAQMSLTVATLPVFNISGNNPICAGDSYSINATNSSLSYSWSTGSVSSSISGTLAGTSTFSVTGTASNSCMSSIPFTIAVNPLPLVSINGPSSLCAGSSATLAVSGTASSFTWSTGSNNSSIVISPSANVVYSVTGTDANACMAGTTHSVGILSLPLVSVQSKSIICSGEQAILTATGAMTYQWNTGASTFSISVSPTVATTYTVTGTASNSCVNTATFHLLVSKCTDLDTELEYAGIDSIRLFPNPNEGSFFVQINSNKTLSLSVYDLLGNMVFQCPDVANQKKLDSGLQAGLYNYILRENAIEVKSGKLLIH